jgi:hypothetical protein
MNHTTLALVAVLAAAALVIGTLATIASPAFAGGGSDSSKTITKQVNKQKQVLSGFVTFGSQDASNCIAVLNGANACREQALGGLVPRPLLGEEQ